MIKPFTMLATAFLTLMALGHLGRLILGFDVTVNGMAVPSWANLIGLIVNAGLAVGLLRENRKGIRA